MMFGLLDFLPIITETLVSSKRGKQFISLLLFLQQGRRVWGDVIHERADTSERAHPDPARTAVGKLYTLYVGGMLIHC